MPSLVVEVSPDIGFEAVEAYGGGADQVEQRVQQCHAGRADAAEETEPGPARIGCRRHAAQQEAALHPAPAGADDHIESGALPEVPPCVHHQVLSVAWGYGDSAEVAD